MFAFYDLETTGTNPAFDQVIQFAGILTDDDLRPQDRINIRCRLSPHILPAPWAMAVTGVSPEILTDPTLPSLFDFTQTLTKLIKRWGPATWVGYNSISFDEEMLRQALYQNLHPNFYLTQLDGNQRLDIMKLVYSTWELAPEAVIWPTDDQGRHSFKLDRLAPANGFEHHDAHDALGDVEATMHIAKLIRDKAPEVWDQALRNRSKHDVNALLESGQPLRLVERFGAAPPRSFIGALAGRNPENLNAVGFIDLQTTDPEQLAGQGDDAIANALSATPKMIRTITVNKCPSLYTVDDVVPEISRRADALNGMSDFHRRVGQALAGRYADREEPAYMEQRIYGGFYSNADRRLVDQFQSGDWPERLQLCQQFGDDRLRELGSRLIFLNTPDLLDAAVQGHWSGMIHERWNSSDSDVPWMTLDKAADQLAEIEASGQMPEAQFSNLVDFYYDLIGSG